jgi:oligoendopeptidase F
MLDKRFAAAAELVRDENVPLLTEEQELGARYAQLVGKRSVPFRGTAMREQECAALLEDADRATRRDAFAALVEGRGKDAEETDAIFDDLVSLRDRIARNAGCRDYVEFRFRDLQRFDYGPRECEAFHDAVERYAVPAVTAVMERRRKALGLTTIRPYDLLASFDGKTLGKPFVDEASLVDLGCRLLRAVDPVFEEEFRILSRNGLLDLMARPGKAPGGFNTDVADLRLPFVYANSVGRHQDVTTLLHEAGHAFHTLATRDEPVQELSHAPTEFCEVASMAMELFGLEQFEATFPRDEAREAAIRLLEHRLTILPWIATIDAFQHWVYGNPRHRRAERREAWAKVRRRFSPHVDWSGLEEALFTQWHTQLHLFEYAFYYIEYGIASLGSLQLWQRFRKDPKAAVTGYRAGLALGGSRPLPELFATTAARFAMDGPAVKEAVDGIVARFAELR